MNRTVITPLIILSGMIGSVLLMAGSSIFTPLVRFIHNGAITPLQAGACLVFSIAGFAACHFLLQLLYSYFVPRMEPASGNIGVIFGSGEKKVKKES